MASKNRRKDRAVRVSPGVFLLPSGKYQIEWRNEYRKRRQQTLGYNRRAAQDAYAKKIVLRAEHRTLDVKKDSRKTFQEVAAEYLREHAKRRKRSWYTDYLKINSLFNPFFGSMRIGDVGHKEGERYACRRLDIDQVDGATVNREIDILKKIFEKSIDWGYVEMNPFRKFEKYPEKPARDRYLQVGEVTELCKAVERLLAKSNKGKGWRGFHLKQFAYLIPLAFDTGARREEIIRLTDDDINMPERLIRYRFWKGKKHEEKTRWVPMTDRVFELLRSMPRNPDTPYLFPDENGHLWRGKKSFYRAFHLIVKESGLKDVDFHRLRHSFNTHLALNSVDERTRMELMGHTCHATQARYTHLTNDHKRKAIELLGALGKKNVETFWRLGEAAGRSEIRAVVKTIHKHSMN